MNIDEKLEESIENKYMKEDKDKNKMELTIEESVYILKRRDFNYYVEEKAIETLLTAYEKEKEKNKRAEELYMQHNQMIIDILKECDYMIENSYCMNDIAIRNSAENIKNIAKYYIKEPEWIKLKEE